MSRARLSRWTRRFLLVSAACLVCAQLVILTGGPRRVEVVLGLYGFVLTTVFGKAYSLVPSYFDRSLRWDSAPMVQLPLTTAGVAGLVVAGYSLGPPWLAAASALVWVGGVGIFLGTILATVGGNLTGSETGTGEANADRETLDRMANSVVPVVLLYLALGCVELLATTVGTPSLLGGLAVATTHLFATGVALLLLFGIGYRLLPRFLVVYPSGRLAAVVLTTGALGPALLVLGYPAGTVFQVGALVESTAVIGFAVAYIWMVVETDRTRVGIYGPLGGVILGAVGVTLGAYFALVGIDQSLGIVHRRLNVFGLLGLSIVGAVYQFYPPAVCPWPGGSDRTAVVSLGLISGGLALAGVTAVVAPRLESVGYLAVLAGALAYSYLLTGTIRYQTRRER